MRSARRYFMRGAVIPVVTLLAPSAARAQDLSELEGLLTEQVVTSASKRAEDASSAPALATNVTAEDLRKYGITTLAEAIDFVAAGAHTSDNLNGGEIGARGVLLTGDRGSHFLLLVDGHTMNEPLRGSTSFGVGAGIPLELVDHIEVVVGPGSVLYGSNAMLGLINVVTKRAKDFSGVRLIVESTIPTTIRASAGAGHKFSLFGQEGEITTQLEYFRQRGPSLFFNAENTGVDKFTGKLGRNSRDQVGTGIWGGRTANNSLYADAPSGILRIVVGKTEIDIRGAFYRHAAPTGQGDFDDAATGDREERFSVDLRHHRPVSTLLEVSSRLYADYYQLSSDILASRGSLCPFGLITCDFASTGSVVWTGVDLQTSWDWLRTGRFVTVAGLEGRVRKFATSNAVLNATTTQSVFPSTPGLDVVDGTVGAYVQQTWAITPTLAANGGARFDWDKRFPAVVTPRLALNWKAWKGGILKAAYAEAFRAPSWDETNNFSSYRIVADGLAPEKVQSVEVSAEHKAGMHRVFVGGFYAHWANLVQLATLSDKQAIQAIRDGKTSVPYTPGVELTQYQNVAEIQNYGMSTGVDGAFGYDRFRYGLTVTGAIANRQTSAITQRLAVAPQLFGNARMAVVLGDNLPTIALGARFMGQRAADHAFDGNFTPTPYAAPQMDLRLAVTGGLPWVKGLLYRAVANYAVADRGPYVIGPVTSALPTQVTAQLNPIDRFRVIVGLQYEL